MTRAGSRSGSPPRGAPCWAGPPPPPRIGSSPRSRSWPAPRASAWPGICARCWTPWASRSSTRPCSSRRRPAGRGRAVSVAEPSAPPPAPGHLTATPRMLPIAALAVGIGVLASYVATALLALIAFFTNLFFFQRVSLEAASPAAHHLGLLSVLVPVAGCLIIGVMARYGSERIRGHGIPEALEAI